MAISLTAQEIASFDGRHRLATVNGPCRLFRLCGRNASGLQSKKYGRYWFNEKFFWNMLDTISDSANNTAQLNHYLRYLLRESTAVCHDWNSFASIFQLTLPSSQSISVAVGRIAPQPFYSARDPLRRQSLPHELLVGGEFQYIVDLANDLHLQSLVSGPLPLWVHRAGNS